VVVGSVGSRGSRNLVTRIWYRYPLETVVCGGPTSEAGRAEQHAEESTIATVSMALACSANAGVPARLIGRSDRKASTSLTGRWMTMLLSMLSMRTPVIGVWKFVSAGCRCGQPVEAGEGTLDAHGHAVPGELAHHG
jgi:hypothetical protein